MSGTSWRSKPAEIVWRGPSGATVRLNEDGVCLQAPNWLEQSEVEQLLEIIAAARRSQMEQRADTPAAPTPADFLDCERELEGRYQARQVANFIRGGYREPTPNKAVEVPF